MSRTTRKTALLVAIQAAAGVAETLNAGDDRIIVANLQPDFDPQTIQSAESTGTLDDNEGTEVTGMRGGCSFDVELTGEGAAGSAPRWGKLLKACSLQEQITAAPVGQTACQAGGSTTTVQLDAAASSVDDIYRGLPIKLSGDMTDESFISAYDGTSKTATVTTTLSGTPGVGTTYEIPANVLYRPGSGTIPTLTVGIYIDDVEYIFEGCRGNVQLIMETGGIAKLRVTLQGNYVSKNDVAAPTNQYSRNSKIKFIAGRAVLDRNKIATQNIQLDLQAALTFDPNPNQAQGTDAPDITGRNLQLTLDPRLEGKATRDTVADMLSGKEYLVNAVAGSSAGNRIGLTVPRGLNTSLSAADRQSVATEQLSLTCKGGDSGAFICLH